MIATRNIIPPPAKHPDQSIPFAQASAAREQATPPFSTAAKRAFGPLLPLICHPSVSDVLVHVRHGRGEAWLDRGGTLTALTPWSCTPEAVRTLACALIAAGGRHLDERAPIADVHLGGGVRVHAVLPPVSAHGAAVSIRVPHASRPTFREMVRNALCSERVASRILHAIHARNNILITGGTGTGKTTLLAALLDEIDAGERIVTIEDLAELQLTHPHHVALETRQSNTEGVGQVTLETLLHAALRMRPTRIVLGECRGAEIVTLLAALNTGHDGGAGTLHASRIADVPVRLEALGTLAGLSSAALARQAATAVHLIVHLERTREGSHRIAATGSLKLTGDALTVTEH